MSISDRIREGIEDVLVDYGNEREDAAYSHRVRPDLAGSVDKIMALLAPAPLREEWSTYDPDNDHMWARTNRLADSKADAERQAASFGYEIHHRFVTRWKPTPEDL